MTDRLYERAAMTKARELGLTERPRFIADVLTARELGRQMDAAASSPSFRLTTSFQAAMGVLERRGAALAREVQASPTAGRSPKARLLQAMRERAAGGPRDDREADTPPVASGMSRRYRRGTGSGTGQPTRTALDVELLTRLSPPPQSRRDVMERLSWGTGRASTALRIYRQEEGS